MGSTRVNLRNKILSSSSALNLQRLLLFRAADNQRLTDKEFRIEARSDRADRHNACLEQLPSTITGNWIDYHSCNTPTPLDILCCFLSSAGDIVSCLPFHSY